MKKDTITCNGIVIYHYNFTNKEGLQVNSTKLLVNVKGLPVYINVKGMENKNLYSEVIVDVFYDGKNWKVK